MIATLISNALEQGWKQLPKTRKPMNFYPISTTGIAGFAECRRLCRVLFIGHSAKKALPSAALGKRRLSAKIPFTECLTLGTRRTRQRHVCRESNTRQRRLSAKRR
jgi:hypothetical protein